MEQATADQIAEAARQLLPKLEALPSDDNDDVLGHTRRFWDLLEAVANARDVHVPQELASPLTALIQPLAAFAAAHTAAPFHPQVLAACVPACLVVHNLLRLATAGQLALSDADALRLLSAGSIPLQILPRLLLWQLQLVRNTAQVQHANIASSTMIQVSSKAVTALVAAVLNPASAMPQRPCAAARATALRPEAWVCWIQTMADVHGAVSAHLGPAAMSFLPLHAIASIIASDGSSSSNAGHGGRIRAHLSSLPPRQQAHIVRQAVHMQLQLQQAPKTKTWCQQQNYWLAIAADASLKAGRQQHERDTGGSLMQHALQLLQCLLPEVGSQAPADVCTAQAHTVLTCVQLLGLLFRDVAARDSWQQCEAALPQLLPALQGMHRLYAAIAAAAPEPGVPFCPSSAAALPWQDPRLEAMFNRACCIWTTACTELAHLADCGDLSSVSVACTAASESEPLLRLAALMPQLPVAQPGSSPAADGPGPAFVSAGSNAAAAAMVPGRDIDAGSCSALHACAAVMQSLATSLLVSVGKSRPRLWGSMPRVPGDPVALGSFHTVIAACKLEWAGAAHGSAPTFFKTVAGLTPSGSPIHPVCMAAITLHLGLPRDADVQRRLDCLVLTYLEALEAKPAIDSSGPPLLLAMTCMGSVYCFCGTGSLLLQDASLSHKAAVQALKLAATSLRICGMQATEVAHQCVDMLWKAVRASPDVLCQLVARPGLLRQVASLALCPPSDTDGIEHGLLEDNLEALLTEVVVHLQQHAMAVAAHTSAAEQAAALAALRQCDLNVAPLAELGQLIIRYCDSQPSSNTNSSDDGSGSIHPLTAQPAPSTPEVAVRRAQALALRSCANPRCANLAGAGEAALKGRRCGGCGVVRYCSEACSHADWRAHKAACRLLTQMQQQQPSSANVQK